MVSNPPHQLPLLSSPPPPPPPPPPPEPPQMKASVRYISRLFTSPPPDGRARQALPRSWSHTEQLRKGWEGLNATKDNEGSSGTALAASVASAAAAAAAAAAATASMLSPRNSYSCSELPSFCHTAVTTHDRRTTTGVYRDPASTTSH